MKSTQTGLFIGRFQPFHLGHLSAIKQGLDQCEKIILVIGSANRNFSVDNPLSLSERKQIVELVIQKENLQSKVSCLSSLDDNPDNLAWTETMIQSLPPFEVVIGNNALVTVLTEYMGYAQFHPHLTKREILQGVMIRKRVIESKKWQDRVSEYTLPLLEQFGFEKRLKNLAG